MVGGAPNGTEGLDILLTKMASDSSGAAGYAVQVLSEKGEKLAADLLGEEREIVLRTKIRLKNGGTVLLGGPPIRAGVLVLALSARG